jgi:ribonuclease I
MNSYWLPNSGTAESFWEHEWNKHGTCINTLAPGCYGDDYQVGDEVVDFFNKAVETFKVSFGRVQRRSNEARLNIEIGPQHVQSSCSSGNLPLNRTNLHLR